MRVRVGSSSPAALLVVGRRRRIPDRPHNLAAPVSHRAWTRVTWSRLVQVHGLVDAVHGGVLLVAALGAARVRFHGLVNCVRDGVLLSVPWWKVPVNMQPKFQHLCRLTDSGWCLFRLSTECWTLLVCYRDRSAQHLLCGRPLRFHSCSSWPSSLSCLVCATTSFATDSAENSGIAAGAAPVVLWRHCDRTA